MDFERIILDIQDLSASVMVPLKHREHGKTIRFTLMQGGFPYTIPTGCFGVLTATKPDGNVLYNHCTIDGNSLVYEVTEQTTAVVGGYFAALELYNQDQQLLISPKFRMVVDGTIYNQGAVESTPEFTGLDKLIAETNVAKTQANAAADAATKAAGEASTSAKTATDTAGRADTATAEATKAKEEAVTASHGADQAAEVARTSAKAADTAAGNANTKAAEAAAASQRADTAAAGANAAAEEAGKQSLDAKNAAAEANRAATGADAAANRVNDSIQAAANAASAATTAAGKANQAAGNASDAAGAAETAAATANSAAEMAKTAGTAADNAANSANKIAEDLQRKLAAGELNGKTPMKGTDYFTTAEVQQFEDAVYDRAVEKMNPVLESAGAATQAAGTAAKNADVKAKAAETAAQGADTAAAGANQAAAEASKQSSAAGEAANGANHASGLANAAANGAEQAAKRADTAAQGAGQATQEATTAAASATKAAGEASASAKTANDAAAAIPGQIAGKLDKPAVQPAVGQILKVQKINPDGTFVVGWADDGGGTVQDVQINGATIVQDGVAVIPVASNNRLGVVRSGPGILVNDGGSMYTMPASHGLIDARTEEDGFSTTDNNRFIISPSRLDYAVKAAMCDGKGSAWTLSEQAAARDRIGIEQLTDIDSLYRSLVNVAGDTQAVDNLFVQWWGSVSKTEEDKVKLLERWFGTVLTDARVHGVKMPLFATSQSYIGELTDDSAGLVCEPSTSTKAGRDDFAHLPQFWTLEVAMERNMDGTHTINKIEHIDPIDEVRSGAHGLCQVLQKNTWVREWKDHQYHYMQMCCNPADTSGWHTWPQGTSKPGRVYAYIANPKYAAGIGADGVITCGTGLMPVLYTSHTQGVSLWRKRGAQYSGGSGNLMRWQMAMIWLKYAKKGNSGIIEGCSIYYNDLKAAVSETGVSRVIVPQAKGKTVIPGSCVSVGTSAYGGQILQYGVATDVSDVVIDDITYAAITVDAGGKTWDTVSGTTHINTLPWKSGQTDAVLGYDGGCTNPTNGMEPGLIQRTEFMNGAYYIVSDELFVWNKLPDGSHTLDIYVCQDQSKVSGKDITSDYVKQDDLTITIPASDTSGWYYIEDLAVGKNPGVLWPSKISKAAGSGTGVRDAVYIGVADSGTRASWRFGDIGNGGIAGLAAFISRSSVGHGGWNGSVGSPSGISG